MINQFIPARGHDSRCFNILTASHPSLVAGRFRINQKGKALRHKLT